MITNPVGLRRSIVDLPLAYGYAYTKSTDLVHRLCSLDNIIKMRIDDRDTTGAYLSK